MVPLDMHSLALSKRRLLLFMDKWMDRWTKLSPITTALANFISKAKNLTKPMMFVILYNLKYKPVICIHLCSAE